MIHSVIAYVFQVPVPTLGVVVRGATGLNKTTVVVALHRAPIPTTAGKHAEKSAEPKASNSVAQEGYFITRKGNRDMDDDYMVTSGGKGKGRGVMKITLPHYGMVGGVGFVAMEVDSQGFLIMCKAKIRVDSVRLLEEASSAAFSSVIQQLLELEQEHPGQDPPALDAIKGIGVSQYVSSFHSS
jgi:antiviral helicase SKI2